MTNSNSTPKVHPSNGGAIVFWCYDSSNGFAFKAEVVPRSRGTWGLSVTNQCAAITRVIPPEKHTFYFFDKECKTKALSDRVMHTGLHPVYCFVKTSWNKDSYMHSTGVKQDVPLLRPDANLILTSAVDAFIQPYSFDAIFETLESLMRQSELFLCRIAT